MGPVPVNETKDTSTGDQRTADTFKWKIDPFEMVDTILIGNTEELELPPLELQTRLDLIKKMAINGVDMSMKKTAEMVSLGNGEITVAKIVGGLISAPRDTRLESSRYHF